MSSSHSRARVSQRLRWALGWFTSAVLRLVPWQPFSNRCASHGTSLSTAEVNYPSAHRSRWLTLAREWLDDTFDFHLGTGETGG